MVLALQSPETVTALIPVDNAPVSAMLGSPFNDYVKGMKEISEAHVTKQSEADKILAKYEPVQAPPCTYFCRTITNILVLVTVPRNPPIPPNEPNPRPRKRQQDPQIPRSVGHFGVESRRNGRFPLEIRPRERR